MLCVTIDVWPGGDGLRAYRLGEIKVSNQSQRADVSDYEVTYSAQLNNGATRSGDFEVLGYGRHHGWTPLIAKVFARLVVELCW